MAKISRTLRPSWLYGDTQEILIRGYGVMQSLSIRTCYYCIVFVHPTTDIYIETRHTHIALLPHTRLENFVFDE
jgi:hypothetical protein